MKAVIAIFALLSSVATTVAYADQGNQQPTPAAVEQYHYGMHLDVAKVISQTLPQGCETGEARMVYLDSKGEQHTLIYQRLGDDCRG